MPAKVKKKKLTNGILLKHKMYLKELEIKKTIEREDMRNAMMEEEERVNKIRDQAQVQRNKI